MKTFMIHGISVVIPNYNGVDLLAETLVTTKIALVNIGVPFEIIISDDNSTDTSVQWLMENHPEVRVLESSENSGFAIAVNKGVAISKFDKVLLLNSDVKLAPDYFKNQLTYFDEPDAFGVMGRIMAWETDKLLEGAKYPAFHGLKIKTSNNFILKEEEKMNKGIFTFYLSGANALIDKKKFLLLEGFNESFSPYYIEDVDLSLRAWRLGFKCYFDYQSVCRHKNSVTIRSKNSKRNISIIYNRNKFMLHAIHLERVRRIGWYLQLIPDCIIRLLMFRWAYFTSLYQFFCSTGKVRESIRRFEEMADQRGYRKSVSEIASFIKGSVSKVEKKFWRP